MRELDFLDPEKIIFTNSKNIFKADVQIDDRLPNLQGDVKIKLLFDAYHNRKISDEELIKNKVIRVKSWDEIEEILTDGIHEALDELVKPVFDESTNTRDNENTGDS